MKMKDKGEPLTKEGCARVVISKMANVIYSYTVETAIFPYLNKEATLPVSNSDFRLNQDYYFENPKVEDLINRYNIKNQLFLDNMMLGNALMVTILDILEKNPYSRFPNLEQTLENYRKEISQNLLQTEERFKLLDIKAYQKVRNIGKCCREEIVNKNKRYWDYLANDKLLASTKWPSCFKNFEHFVDNNADNELSRRKNRIKTDVSESQRQINDFINPKNMRKRYLELESIATGLGNEGQPKTTSGVSPQKASMSPRHIHI